MTKTELADALHDAKMDGRDGAIRDFIADLECWAADAETADEHRPGLLEAIELIRANYVVED